MEQPSSNLFEGYRSLGHVTGPKPFILRYGKTVDDTKIVTILGRTIHTYSNKLALVETSTVHEKEINTITSDKKFVYSAAGSSIFCWSSKRLVYRFNGHNEDVHILLKLDKNTMLSVDLSSTVIIWSTTDQTIKRKISFDNEIFKVAAVCHPFSYNDKVLFGSFLGPLQLWNVNNEKLLYTYAGWKAKVNIILQSPVTDIVAVGLADGHVVLQNIKYDEQILKIYQEYGPITSMSFRADGEPYLATASDYGHIMLWNLETKRLSSQIRNAHSGPIKCCNFINNQPILVTTGTDNAIKLWSLDMSDGGGRLLSQRAGHSEPPTFIRFYGPKGLNVLSSGLDSTLKSFHIMSERLNRNLGTARMNAKSKQKHLVLGEPNKLPPIMAFACESAREKEWDNIAAIHRKCTTVTTWSYDKCKMGEHRIRQPTFDKHGGEATSVCITSCGNFLLIGFSSGHIFRYNIQSGLFRLSYQVNDLTNERAHTGAISGIEVDSLDAMMVSGSHDKYLKMWNFKSGNLIAQLECDSPITKLILQRETNLLAVAFEDYLIKIIDIETRNPVRAFASCKGRITDICFTSDSRWLIVASMDKCIRTWDISLGRLIDSFAVSTPCVSLTMSPTNEFLATAHTDQLGINLWCNFTVYCPTPLSIIPDDHEPQLLDMPNVKCDDNELNEDDEDDVIEELFVTDQVPHYKSPEQLSKDLISLSDLPSSRWKNLLKIDAIKAQQKIDEQMKESKNKRVPFFIPIIDGLQPKFDVKSGENKEKNYKERQEELYKSRIRELSLISELGQVLFKCSDLGDYSQFFTHLKKLGPSATDAEIRSLGKETCGTEALMICFLEAIDQLYKSNRDFELASSWLALFLKIHLDVIYKDETVKAKLLELSKPLESKWDRLNTEFNQIFSVLNFIRSAIL